MQTTNHYIPPDQTPLLGDRARSSSVIAVDAASFPSNTAVLDDDRSSLRRSVTTPPSRPRASSRLSTFTSIVAPTKPSVPDAESMTAKQKVILVCLMSLHLLVFVCYALVAPFLPREMVEKGGTATLAAWAVSVYEIAILVASPIHGRLVARTGPKLLLCVGCIEFGITVTLFGLLRWTPAGWPFIVLSFVLRILEGIGANAYITASFSIVAHTFPHNFGFVFGLLQGALGTGLFLGPVIGGLLYDWGGFNLPFFVMGPVFLIISIIVMFCLPEQGKTEYSKEKPSFLKLLRVPGIILDAMAVFASSFNIGFLEAVISLYVGPLVNNSALLTGVGLLGAGLAEGIAAPVWGWLADRRWLSRRMICIIGCIMTASSFVFIGPAPFLHLPTYYWAIVACCAVCGAGNGALIPIAFTDAVIQALDYGYPDNYETFGLLSGLQLSSFALGACIGPAIGGPLVDWFNFPWASVAVAAVEVIVGVIFVANFVIGRRKRKIKYEAI